MLMQFKRHGTTATMGAFQAMAVSLGRGVSDARRDIKRHPMFYAMSFVAMVLSFTLTSYLTSVSSEILTDDREYRTDRAATTHDGMERIGRSLDR